MKNFKQYIKYKTKYWLILVGFMPLLVPQISMAQTINPMLISAPTTIVNSQFWPNYQDTFSSAPAKRTIYTVATAYNSEVNQTDSTPFTTASSSTVRDGIIATNMLPFGTKVRLPELYGQKVFVVEDRMNKRYWNRIDIWMVEKQDARKFGVRYLKMEIL